MGKAIRESSVGTQLVKSSTLGMLVYESTKRIILVCVRGRQKIGWKDETDLGETLTMFTWDVFNVNAKQVRFLLIMTETCSYHASLLEQQRNCEMQDHT